MSDSAMGSGSSAPVSSTATVESSSPNTEASNSTENTGGTKTVSFEVKTPPKTPAEQQTPAQKEAARRMKLKIDGRDEEYDENEVVKLAQMGRASQKRFQEAAAMKKQAEDFINMLKKDPRSVLSNPALGVDVRKFAEEFLAEELKRETLSPEQRRMMEMEEQIKKYETDKKSLEEQKQQEELTKLQEHYAQDYDRKITDALSTSGLPKTPRTVKRMAEYLSMGLNNGIDMEPSDVVELVRQDYLGEITDLLGQSDGDTLLKILGDGVANKIRKSDLARLRAGVSAPQAQVLGAQGQTPQTQQQSQSKAAEPAPDKKLSLHEWRAQLEKRMKS